MLRLHRTLNIVLAALLCAAVLIPGVQGQGGGISSGWANRIKAGAAVPGTCVMAAGHVFFRTTGTSNEKGLYQCIDGLFTKVGASSGGGGGGVIVTLGNSGQSASTIRYSMMSLVNQSVEATATIASPKSGTLKNLCLKTNSTTPNTANTFTATLRVNGVNTAIVASVGQNVAATVVCDTTHTQLLSQADLLTIEMNNTFASISPVYSVTFAIS